MKKDSGKDSINHSNKDSKSTIDPNNNANKDSNSSRFGSSNPCSPCIRCCQGQLIKITEEDILRWKREQRYDILLCMETWTDGIPFLIQKKDKTECTFLTDKGCSIHETRPEICVKFPASYTHAKEMDCKLSDLFKDKTKETSIQTTKKNE